MKKVFIYLIFNTVLIFFLVYLAYLLATSSWRQDVSMTIRIILGLMNYGIMVLLAMELNRRLKLFLDKKSESDD
jgi:hypothetical protein